MEGVLQGSGVVAKQTKLRFWMMGRTSVYLEHC